MTSERGFIKRSEIPASPEVWRHAYREFVQGETRRHAYSKVIRQLMLEGKLGPEWAKYLPEAPECGQ